MNTVYHNYLDPKANLRWQSAGGNWSVSHAEIDAKVGGRFSVGYKSAEHAFDFAGEYTELVPSSLIKYKLDDGRMVSVTLSDLGGETKVEVEFDPESVNSEELQIQGWSAVLANFKDYCERIGHKGLIPFEKNIEINSSAAKLFETLSKQDSYREWTKVFDPGSHYEGEMKYGSKIRFLSEKDGGMYSEVEIFIPDFQIGFKHLGYVKPDGSVDVESSDALQWSGAREVYTITVKDNEKLNLNVYCETGAKYEEMMSGMWDKAVLVVKEISER